MGLALAQACERKGFFTRVLLGPVESTVREDFSNVAEVVDYETSQDLQSLLGNHWPSHDVLLMAAAVSDLRPVEVAKSKLPRAPINLRLEPVPDLLADLARQSPSHGIRVGFALEAESELLTGARKKLSAKQCHAIAANPLSTIDSNMVSGVWVTNHSEEALGQMSKKAYAEELLDRSHQLWSARTG